MSENNFMCVEAFMFRVATMFDCKAKSGVTFTETKENDEEKFWTEQHLEQQW